MDHRDACCPCCGNNGDAAEAGAADITVLLYPCRIALVGAMPAVTRACWRLVNERTRDDVFDACIRLRWRDPGLRRHGLLAGVTKHGQCPPDKLPTALIAKLPALKQLLCHNLDSLTTLKGLPCDLEHLELSGTTMSGVVDFSPMAACIELRVFDVHDSSISRAQALQLGTQGISAFTSLRCLNLADCFLAPGSVANLVPAIGNLSQLQQLVMAYNDLVPDDVAALASAVTNLKLLQHLCVEYNNLAPDGAGAMDVAAALQHLTCLRHLGLKGNNLAFPGTRDICAALVCADSLELLDLSANALGPAGAAVLAPALAHLTNLTSLYLNTNRLGHGEGPAYLCSSLQLLANLRFLDLSCNMLGVGGLELLAPALQSLRLTALHLRANALGSEGAFVLSQLLEQLGHAGLQDLDICGNELGPHGAAELALGLGCLTDLRTLNLGGNGIKSLGAAFLAPALQHLTRLTKLDCGRNAIEPEGTVHLCEALPFLHLLRVLDLCGNEIGGEEGVQCLTAALPSLCGLEELTLRGNEMGPGAAALGPALSQLTNLRYIDLGDNEMGDEGAIALAPALQCIPHLDLLFVTGNDLGWPGSRALSHTATRVLAGPF